MKKLLKLAYFLLFLGFLLNWGVFDSVMNQDIAQENLQKEQEFKEIALSEKSAGADYRESLMRQYQADFVRSIDVSGVQKFYLSNLVLAFFFLGLRRLAGQKDWLAKNWASIIIGAIVFPLTISWLLILFSIKKVREESWEARVRQRSENIFAEIDPQTTIDSQEIKHAFVYALAVTIFLSALPSMAKVSVREEQSNDRAQIEHLQINHLSPSGVDDDAGSSLVCIEQRKIEMKNFIVSVIITPFEIVERILSRSRRIFHIPIIQN